MFDLDKWQEIFQTFTSNPLRTFLTAFGIGWGIFMLVIMLGTGNGLENGVMERMSGFATNSLYVWGSRTSLPYAGFQPGRNIRMNNRDMEAIRENVEGIEYLAPRNQLGGYRSGNTVRRGAETGSYSVMGDYPQMRHIKTFEITKGRFINELDIEGVRKVAVIGRGVYETLFPDGEYPIGQSININNIYFEVVGLFDMKGAGDRGDREINTIYIPFSSFQKAFNYGERVSWLAATALPGYSLSTVEDNIKEVLAERHQVSPDDTEAFGSFNSEERFGKLTALFKGIRFFIWIVGIGTLLAGMIGVSNIMLIIVKERTREFGIRKALGASPLSIIALILQESIFLTSLAGYIGLVLGVGLVELINYALDNTEGGVNMFSNPEVHFEAAVTAFLLLMVVGMIAGVAPARKAAATNPVFALRNE